MYPVNSVFSRASNIPGKSHVLSAAQKSSTNGSQGVSAFFGQHQVSISKLSKPLVLKCLWDNAKGEGVAFTKIKNPAILMAMKLLPEMDIKIAEQHIQNAQSKNLPLSFGYLDNKPLEINITGNNLNTQSYDHYHGDGSAKRAIYKAKELDDREKYPEERYLFDQFDQAVADHPNSGELTEDQLLDCLMSALHGKDNPPVPGNGKNPDQQST
ncbi:hypothetical protein J7438_10720 [Thalassotalea sp. G20_0]|uniref:hypothetical protein n=1 Tax=Thalassotalea sp. G20_0 TaxID=2821093 RepID=UPI001ADA8633|nr:hypothetical protein [Thalassotalea sp. G20_0]MBO9494558.1 hypothetical protein [Thalassotalea sp. G20_0]